MSHSTVHNRGFFRLDVQMEKQSATEWELRLPWSVPE